MFSEDGPTSETAIVNPVRFIFNLSMEITSLHSDMVQREVLILFKCTSCVLQERATGKYTVSKSIGRCVQIVCLHPKIMHV